jgi:hypothetical protein
LVFREWARSIKPPSTQRISFENLRALPWHRAA